MTSPSIGHDALVKMLIQIIENPKADADLKYLAQFFLDVYAQVADVESVIKIVNAYGLRAIERTSDD